MAAGQKIHLTITGIQYPVGAEDEEAVTTVQEIVAEYFHKGDTRYLFYEELPEGLPAPLKTRIKLKNQTFEIFRQGPGGSTMFFAPNQTYRTEYPTPYGTLLLDIVTSSVTVESKTDAVGQEDTWPDVIIEYLLENEGEVLARYRLSVCATGAKC